MAAHVHRRGSLSRSLWELDLTPAIAGWSFARLRVARVEPEQRIELLASEDEMVVVPLEGLFVADVAGASYELGGRESVFSGPTDVIYVPRVVALTLSTALGGRVAIASAPARVAKSVQYVARDRVPLEARGAGSMSRLVRDFGGVGAIDADRLICCEVITPGGNWSSYPPHKHDESTESESELEEIYYFEVQDGPTGPGAAFQRVSSSPGHEIDVLAEVRSGDAVTIPFGWHGPSMAAPGYDLYYLNVMAGPATERSWKITDHPDSGWVRRLWPALEVDPRIADELER